MGPVFSSSDPICLFNPLDLSSPFHFSISVFENGRRVRFPSQRSDFFKNFFSHSLHGFFGRARHQPAVRVDKMEIRFDHFLAYFLVARRKCHFQVTVRSPQCGRLKSRRFRADTLCFASPGGLGGIFGPEIRATNGWKLDYRAFQLFPCYLFQSNGIKLLSSDNFIKL